MSDLARNFHESWLGMVQPVEGLVVSVPVLVDAGVMDRRPPAFQELFHDLCPADASGKRRIRDLRELFARLLDLPPTLFDAAEALPEDLSFWVEEGRQTLRPTLALRRQHTEEEAEKSDLLPDDSTPPSRAGAPYVALVWELPPGLDLDRPEKITGAWEYPPAAKFDRLLRACRVPIGLLTNGAVVRLVFAPHGESSGAITFRVEDMGTIGGRPILDAFVSLLSAQRLFGVSVEQQLPAILRQSRTRQANVTNELAEQVFEAVQLLLAGFEAAAERDKTSLLREAVAREDDHAYGGLLTVMLRLVFVLYAEDRGLLPVENRHYGEHLSALGLFAQLQGDHAAYPDSLSRRFGAWPRLLSLFRAIFYGVSHGDLRLPPRHGDLFDPQRYPFLEGWGPEGSAPVDPLARAQVVVPSLDDETVFGVLEKLLVFEGQRLSYRALDVEQIGSVYEALMGYHVEPMQSEAVCVRPNRVWIPAATVLEQPAARRAAWVVEEAGLPKGEAKKLEGLKAATDEAEALLALGPVRVKRLPAAQPGRLVLQPGSERRRTSSHYTPRSLSAPIVRRTLEPLLGAMGGAPPSERLLNLKICDPAMGSGAFLVEACRFLADQVVAAWTREGRLELVASATDDVVNHARRLVGQRCLYGVDKNPYAVSLAKLSLWLVTLAKDEPFTFLDHALRHGDSLVGLDLDQIRAFHWEGGQGELFAGEVKAALAEALSLRQEIVALAGKPGAAAQKEKERLLADAEAAVDRVRLIADLVVGAWFGKEKPKERLAERHRRLELVRAWLREGGAAPAELRGMRDEIRRTVPAFHWMLELPEVFYGERPDPLDAEQVNRAAWMDAFVGNPPFAGKNAIVDANGPAYLQWLLFAHTGSHGNADVSAHFFRRTFYLLGYHGCLGLISTNTIAQGDTRASGLQAVARAGGSIYDATSNLQWPGVANVSVSVLHIAKGALSQTLAAVARLDGRQVPSINSRLRPGSERPDLVSLRESEVLRFSGVKVYGEGFILSAVERERLLAFDERLNALVVPYIGGEEVNTSPTQAFTRYVINFRQMTLEAAESYPALLQIVRERVKPERDLARDNADGMHRKKYWWQFAQPRPELFAALTTLTRCLVVARVTKHLCFSFQPTDRAISETAFVLAIEDYSRFGVLQSRLHEAWAVFLSSSMRNDLRYSGTDCFDTFPFPSVELLSSGTDLDQIATQLYERRAQRMVAADQGLTATYNLLRDRCCREKPILDLRRLHEDLDRAVLTAYGWGDLSVPPFCPLTPGDLTAVAAFEEQVIERLFVLNAQRADEERLLGVPRGANPKGKKRPVVSTQLSLVPRIPAEDE